MLKIRDDVDLKELEYFGFKPKYDEDTGELKEYYRDFLQEDEARTSGVWKETIKFYIEKKKRLFKTYRCCTAGTWNVFERQFGYKYIDLIYDLIKVGLVVKE